MVNKAIQHRFDLPGGSQEEGLTEETGYMLSQYSKSLGFMMC